MNALFCSHLLNRYNRIAIPRILLEEETCIRRGISDKIPHEYSIITVIEESKTL